MQKEPHLKLLQTYEFKAVHELAAAFKAVPAQSAEDFTEKFHAYEAALAKLVKAMKANGRML